MLLIGVGSAFADFDFAAVGLDVGRSVLDVVALGCINICCLGCLFIVALGAVTAAAGNYADAEQHRQEER